MKSNPTPNMYQLPLEIQKEFHYLMKSKESFSSKLTIAEQRKLETLYAKLINAWSRNRTEELNNSLNKKYNELRKLQESINQDWMKYKTELRLKYLQNLEKEEKNLTKEIADFNQTKETWKEDIIQKETYLEKKKRILTGKLSFDTELENLKKKLEASLNLKRELLKKTKEELEVSSNQTKVLRENLMMKRDQSMKNLKDYEAKLLKELEQEILKEMMNYPEELKKIFESGNTSEILRKRKGYMNDTEIIKKSLEAELGKNGKDLNWFESTLNDKEKQLRIDL